MQKHKKIRRKILLEAVVATVCTGVIFMSFHAWFLQFVHQSSGALSAYDTSIYLAVGRGMLNGLMPYKDLYENKPLGIFLLSAFSVLETGGSLLTGYFVCVAILSMIASVFVAVFALSAGRPYSVLRFIMATGFSAMLAMYTWQRSGGFQVELFGAAACAWYVTILSARGDQPLKGVEFFAAVGSIALSLLMKEPFGIVVIACGMILSGSSIRMFLSNVIAPLCMAVVLVCTLLVGLDILDAYVSVYLHEIFLRHVLMHGSPWIRAFQFLKIGNDLLSFSPLFAGGIGLLLLLVCVNRLSLATRRQNIFSAAKLLTSMYMISFAVGLGGPYYSHHFIFAVPFFCALYFVFLRESFHPHWERTMVPLQISILSVIVSMAVAMAPEKSHASESSVPEQARFMSLAHDFDVLLDHCGIDRYLYLGDNGFLQDHSLVLYGFTRHSPLGPLFFQYPYYFDGTRPDFEQLFLHSFTQAKIVVETESYDAGLLTTFVHDTLERDFTLSPWPCAAGYRSPDGFRVHFRDALSTEGR